MEKSLLIEKSKKLKSKAVKWFGLFLVFMLLCTVISRGVYAYLMPQVTLGRMEQKTLKHSVEAVGSFAAAGEKAVLAPQNMRIEEVFVRTGENVSVGTVLFQLDRTELDKTLEKLEEEIAISKQRLKEAESEARIGKKTRELEAARAKQDLDQVMKSQDLILQQAKQRYQEAQSVLSQYPTFDVYYANQLRQDTQYQALAKDPEQQETFQNYTAALQLSLSESWQKEKKALENAVRDTLGALQIAEQDSNIAIGQAKRRVEDSGRETAETTSGRMQEEQNLRMLQEERDLCRSLQEEQGRVVCDVEGAVKEIRVETGNRTPDTASMVLADSSVGWVFEALVSKEEKKYLKTGGAVTLELLENRRQIGDCRVLAVEEMDGETYKVTAEVTEEALSWGGAPSVGETGMLSYSSQEGPYACCVPLAAIHTTDNASYLYVIREIETILGTELKAVRRQVNVIARDNTYAALEEGSLGEEERFIITSDKEYAAGDTVRLMEEIE